MIDRFRSKLIQSRGSRGLIALQRTFSMLDTNQSGTLDQYEFTNAIQTHGLDVDQKDIAGLFKAFDRNGDGEISFNEFISAVVGPLSDHRKQIIVRTFKKMDMA